MSALHAQYLERAGGAAAGKPRARGAFTDHVRLKQNSRMKERAAHAAIAAAKIETLVFEQPLNERMRTFLRLDFLYNQALYHNEMASQWGSRAAVACLSTSSRSPPAGMCARTC